MDVTHIMLTAWESRLLRRLAISPFRYDHGVSVSDRIEAMCELRRRGLVEPNTLKVTIWGRRWVHEHPDVPMRHRRDVG
jgi:hypothetical protein